MSKDFAEQNLQTQHIFQHYIGVVYIVLITFYMLELKVIGMRVDWVQLYISILSA